MNGVLAFNDPFHDSSFCMYDDASVTHIEAERFTRQKYEDVNPILVFCEMYPELIESFTNIAVEETQYAVAPFIRRVLAWKQRGEVAPSRDDYAVPYAIEHSRRDVRCSPVLEDTERVEAFVHHLLRKDVQVFFCGHHASHAANAFFSSGYASAVAITLDGIGFDYDLRATRVNVTRSGQTAPTRRIPGSVFHCAGDRCEVLHQLVECSFGFAWARVTEHVLGYGVGQEGTVMGMAALGDPQRHEAAFAEPWAWLPVPDGELAHEESRQLQGFMAALRSGLVSEQDRFDVAAGLQAATESRLQRVLAPFLQTGEPDVCLAGGVVLNCQMVGKLRSWFPNLRRIFVPPAPYDGGISIGAAQLVYHSELGGPKRRWPEGLAPFAMGPAFSRLQITSACRSARIPIVDGSAADALNLLQQGGIVGLFAGSAESGRRALGHRSIVADPRVATMKERLNAQIKHREWFRPFAPMVLAEDVAEWFECGKDFMSPYMSFAVPVRPECRSLIPAVVHFDGTARVQTVHRELTPALHAMLTRWKAMTGVPLLLNTSFNEREPIVETPADALNTMTRAQLDALFFVDVGILATPSHAA